MTTMRIVKQIGGVALLVGATVSCGDVARQSQSPVYLVINNLEARRGGGNNTTSGNILLSDVITNVTSPAPCSAQSPCPTIFNDFGSATLSLAMKDVTTGLAPTTNNTVTLSRYRVSYRRADGRNTPGVDVPYPFDGAATVTVTPTGVANVGFEIVRHVAKQESPLAQLQTNPGVITTITEVTFYGTDRVGNDVSVTGTIQIDFGNFGDQ
jgi:hypothetical protein